MRIRLSRKQLGEILVQHAPARIEAPARCFECGETIAERLHHVPPLEERSLVEERRTAPLAASVVERFGEPIRAPSAAIGSSVQTSDRCVQSTELVSFPMW